MVELYGRNWTQQELIQRVGRVSQLGGVRLADLADGNSRGVRTAEFETGSGFGFQVLLDRGMDICAAKYRGASLSWEAAPGPAHPAYHEREGLGWLRTFHGGLVAGCGLTARRRAQRGRGREPGAARPPESHPGRGACGPTAPGVVTNTRCGCAAACGRRWCSART